MIGAYRRGRSGISSLQVHLVFVMKFRRDALRPKHLDLLDDVFAKACSAFGTTLVECNGDDAHVHLLVEYPATVAISSLVNSLKGVPNRRLRQRVETPRTRTTSGRPPTSAPRSAAHPIPAAGNTSKPSAERPECHRLTSP
jgi:REP element-mobilizing transposase RayT